MEPLAPIFAVAGGLLIGLSAGLLLLTTGRIAGISGLTARTAGMTAQGPTRRNAAAFLIGLPLGTALIALFVRQPDVVVTGSVPLLVVAGLLVGFGTRLGSGCTSGHGVCGMSRLSPRSIVATLMFMGVAFLVVYVARHVIGG